jgi:hypothetical protein
MKFGGMKTGSGMVGMGGSAILPYMPDSGILMFFPLS